MSNTSIFINTAATDIAKAKTISLAQLATQGFPVLAYGDLRPFDFYFHNQGTIEAFSGNASYGLRATLGNVNSGPFGGTYTLTCGSTSEALANDTDAAGLQDELNLLTSVISGGGIDVTGEFPDFFLTWRTVGSKTAITASAINLVPDSGIVLTTLTAGDGTRTERIALTLRQNAISSTTTFTTISSPYAGWTGTLDTSTNGALALLLEFGEAVGDFVQVNTVLTLELITPAGKYVTYFQGHVVLRAKNVDLGATGSASISQYVIQGPITTSGLTMNTARLLGRSTAGVGEVEELTVGTGLTLSGGVLAASGSLSNPMTTLGDIITGGASGTPTRLGIGSTNQVLTVVGGVPAWADAGAGSGTVTSVAMATPTFLTVAGSPITTSGTLALTWSGLTTNGLMQATGATAMSSTLTPSGLTSIGVNSVTSASGQPLTLSAGGTNENVLLQPNGTGNVVIPLTALSYPAPQFQGLQLVADTNVRATVGIDTFGTQGALFLGRRAMGTPDAPSAAQTGATLSQFSAEGYGATGYVAARPGITFFAQENFTDSAAGAGFNILGIVKGTTTAITLLGSNTASGLIFGSGSTSSGRNSAAWGTTGIQEQHTSGTFTDSSSSGTVATAVANSFGASTFAASSATTFTNAANLYIAGDVAAGTNVTLTNSYGLWNVGKSRLDGNVTAGGTLSVTGHTTFEGVTSTGATGTGKLVYDGSPTLTTPVLGAATYTTLSGGNITDSGLTAGRVTFAGTAGLLSDAASLTFDSGTGALSATSFSGAGTGLTGTAAGLTAGTASAVAIGGITGLGTGVATALAVANNTAGGYSPIDGTTTLTNKRITLRIAPLTDAATVTPATDAFDGGILTALSQDTTLANPTGTPTEGQKYTLRVKSTSVRTWTYGSQYRGSADMALPAATSGASLTDYFIFQWNGADSKWDLLGRNFGF